MKSMRALIPVTIAAALLLSGCSGAATKDATGAECAPAGGASDAVKVEGEFGAELKLTSETPAEASELERTVIEEGTGKVVEEGGTINAAMTYFNGATGEAVQHVPASPVTNDKEALLPWAYEAVRCAAPEQRAAIVLPASDVLNRPAAESGIENLTDDDTMIIVMDFSEAEDAEAAPAQCDISNFDTASLPARAEGEEEKAPEGFPSVKLDGDGAPTITMPEGVEPPTELEIATLIKGDGPEVEAGACVAVNYRGVIWSTGEEFDSSWSRGEPVAFSTEGVIGGFKEALEGQTVGSQVISVVPAEDGGYGAAKLEQMGHAPDAVMVFVLDILAVEE